MIASTDTNAREFDQEDWNQFWKYYYLSGKPEEAAPALRFFLDSDLIGVAIDNGPDGPMPYFFYRIAQLHPEVWSQYASLLEQINDQQRSLVLWIFALERPEEAEKYLRRFQKASWYGAANKLVDSARKGGNVGNSILSLERITSRKQLDLLWGEFLVTGDERAIRRIIDALERPDLLRKKLNGYLVASAESPSPDAEELAELRRNLLSYEVILSEDGRAVRSAQDLDCFLAMNGCAIEENRFESVFAIFPFFVTDFEREEILFKSAAKWSLCSNAQEHAAVRKICIGEAKIRCGRCRLSLLEIVSRVFLAAGDLESGLNYFVASLVPDPTARDRSIRHAEAEYEKYLSLAYSRDQCVETSQQEASELIQGCLLAGESLHAYRAKMVWIEGDSAEQKNGKLFWEFEFESPDRFRVAQTAGMDFDEWIIVADNYYRSPGYYLQPDPSLKEADTRMARMLLVDHYLRLMKSEQPDSVCTQSVDGNEFLLITYTNLDIGALEAVSRLKDEGVSVNYLRLWFDGSSRFLRRAELLLHSETEGDSSPIRVQHIFASVNEDLMVIPPPFSVFATEVNAPNETKEMNSSVEWRNRIRVIGGVAGLSVGVVVGSVAAWSEGGATLWEFFLFSSIAGFLLAGIGFVAAETGRRFSARQRRLDTIEHDTTEQSVLSATLKTLVFMLLMSLMVSFQQCEFFG